MHFKPPSKNKIVLIKWWQFFIGTCIGTYTHSPLTLFWMGIYCLWHLNCTLMMINHHYYAFMWTLFAKFNSANCVWIVMTLQNGPHNQNNPFIIINWIINLQMNTTKTVFGFPKTNNDHWNKFDLCHLLRLIHSLVILYFLFGLRSIVSITIYIS